MKRLSQDEMKMVIGGKVAQDHCTWSGLCTSYPSVTYPEGEGWAADQAQQQADAWCAQESCCSDVDCPGAQ